jgi:D-inositol-3-phosphate glycosyltransferase
MSTVLQQNEAKVIQVGRERAAYTLSWMGIIVAMDCDHGAPDAPPELCERPASPQLRRLLPDLLKNVTVETDIAAFADALIASTPAEENQLVELYGANRDKIHVIPPGVDIERFHPIPPAHAKEHIGICPERPIILFVGRIEPLKGIDTLLEAIALVTQRRPEMRDGLCVPIIGGQTDAICQDDEMARLADLRQSLGIEDVVTFLGSKNQDTLQYYYSAAEMVVMPSDYESFGMVALEAMACGTPVIASDVGGLAFLVKDGRTGYRVPAGDPEALAERIAQLLTDELTRRRVGQRATCWAESYAWPTIADRIQDVYRHVRTRCQLPIPCGCIAAVGS